MAISNFLMGPSKMLYLLPYIWIYFIGTALNGVAQGFSFIPILPEVIESLYLKQGITGGDNNMVDGIINDKAAALYGLFYAIGAITAPLLGSMVYALLNADWWYTCDVFAIICSSYVVIFLVFNVMPDIHKEREQRKAMAEKLVSRVMNINVIEEEDVEET